MSIVAHPSEKPATIACEKCKKPFTSHDLVPHRVNLYTMQVCETCNTQMARDEKLFDQQRAALEAIMKGGWK